ncbi:MAG: zinc ribbon domain-containing protein [bacterium]|jgi:hypothetical protein
MIYFIIWIAIGFVGALIAKNKGNSSCLGMIISLILGPIGLLIVFFLPDNEWGKLKRSGHTKQCPYCAEYVRPDAQVCKHCGRDIGNSGFNIESFRA